MLNLAQIFEGRMAMDIKDNLKTVLDSLPQGVTLAAVSKTHSVENIQQAYAAGQRIFAENKVQEMTAKQALLPPDIEWHFIGHVQRNKIRIMAPYVSLIQGVDSFESLQEIDRQAARYGRNIRCLLQIRIATEDTKSGFLPDACQAMLEDGAWRSLNNITICGVMGMASNTDNAAQVLEEFTTLRNCFDKWKQQFFAGSTSFDTVSAGMSHDYPLAIQAGSTMVRVGTAIFGTRTYPPIG